MTAKLLTAGPWPEPAVVTDDVLPLAVIRQEGVRITDLPRIFDAVFSAAPAAIAGSGASIAGPAIAVYEGDPSAEFTIEAGFPVAEPLAAPVSAGTFSVVPAEIPAGWLAVVTHLGSYEDLPHSWERLMRWVADEGIARAPRFGELYVTAPTPDGDPAALRTDLFLTLA
ncbi:MAG: GyrI-like domain-containing protein [Arachnia sp.]